MARFKPFHGILPSPDLVDQVVSKPFDNYSEEEIADILAANPYSFLHVIVPVIPGDNENVPYEEKLLLGKGAFNERLNAGTFRRDDQLHYYIYRQQNAGEQYVGIIGAISIDDCIAKVVKPHEQTIERKEEKLKEYLKIIDINAEPVVISYKADHTINTLTDRIITSEPDLSFETRGFGQHELWKVNDPADVADIQKGFASMSEMYICDGHHRTASSVLFGQEMRDKNPEFSGEESFNHFMAIMFPHHQIRLREFNRLVRDLNGFTIEQFLEELKKSFIIKAYQDIPDISEQPFAFAMYAEKKWYALEPRQEVLNDIPENHLLPTQLLTDLVLSPVLGIHDLRKDKRIAFQGGKTDADKLIQAVDSGKYKAAFVVNKITIPTFKKFADNGWFMPPKSTWFEPKLLNGLVVYSLEGDL